MLLIIVVVFVSCVSAVWCLVVALGRGVRQATRDLLFPVLIFTLLLRDIFKDLVTDFWKNKYALVALPGEVAVITGGARGIGVHVVKKLMQSQMSVVIGCRNVAEGEKLLTQIRKSGVSTGELTSYKLDLTSLTSVDQFADVVLRNHSRIDVLVNNAGITCPTRQMTEYGVESTFGVNYLSHCYLAHLLLPRLAETARTKGCNTRIVHVSSCVHSYPLLADLHIQDLSLRDNYHEYAAYGQSKVAQVMFTKTLDHHLVSLGVPVRVHAAHPGVVHTHMMTQNIFHWALPWVFPLILRTPEEGARSVYYACASPQLDTRGGTYIESSEVCPSGGVSNSELAQKQLWTETMSLLHLKCFGGFK